MRKFIFQVFLFSILVIILIGSLFFFPKKIVERKTNFRISKNIDKIVIGHSQPECAYNDSLINNFKNFSASGEAYFYNYYKLIPLISNNENIKTVFIEFTNNQIAQPVNEFIWGDKYMPYKYALFASYIHIDGVKLLLDKNSSGLINGSFKFILNNLKIIIKNNYSFTFNRGGYSYLIREKVAEELLKQKEDKIIPKDIIISEYNLFYLNKIISFCKKKNIQIYLVRSPMHKSAVGFKNENKFKEILNSRYNTVEFLDFKDFPIENSNFGDLTHLNYKGAKKFSLWFNKLINNDFLKHTKKQELIDLNISELKYRK